MDIAMVRGFFMWSTIINYGLLLLFFLAIASAADWVYRVHSTFFPLSREAFNIAMYAFMGAYKLFIIGFNLVPFIALAIAG
jgi:hypothetical protein